MQIQYAVAQMSATRGSGGMALQLIEMFMTVAIDVVYVLDQINFLG